MGSFVASLGYYNENGVVRNTSFRRFTGSVKGDYQIKPWLKVRGWCTIHLVYEAG